jgi:uncharacterized repeat protein (TIGR01451 family)
VFNEATDQPAGFSVTGPTDLVPTGTRYIWSATGITFYPGTAYTFTITGQVGSVCAQTVVSNTAMVDASTVCSTTAMTTNLVDFTLDAPTVAITAVKTQVQPAPQIGEAITYQIVVTNTGSATLDRVAVMDTVSPVVTGITTVDPAGFGAPVVTTVAGGTSYLWSASGLNFQPGDVLTFEINGAIGLVCAATQVDNEAYATATTARGDDAATTNTVGTLVQPPVDGFTIVKSQTPPTSSMVAPDDPVTYQIVVANTGTSSANMVVVDTVFPEMVVLSTDQDAAFGAPTATARAPSIPLR